MLVESAKPDFMKLQALKDVYKRIQDFKRALDVLAVAMRARPNDMNLSQELKDLGARATLKAGNYEEGDFRKSMRDVAGQKKLMDQDKDIRSLDALTVAINDAEAAYAADPADNSRLTKLVDALRKTEQMEYENRAIELLDAKFKETKQYKYRQQIGQITIAQLARMERTLREEAGRNPGDAEAQKAYRGFLRDRAEQELRIFRETVENYPTDSSARFEMGRRMFLLGQFNDAIPVFQQAQSDPKFKSLARTLLGRAFLEAGYVDEAADTLQGSIADHPTKGDEKSIDMHYWYARALEDKGDFQAALKMYSQVAQWNFNYRDVQARIKRLRSSPPPPTAPVPQGQASAPGAR